MPKLYGTPVQRNGSNPFYPTPPKTPKPFRVVDLVGNKVADRIADRIADSFTQTDTQTKSGTYQQGVTTQHDSKLQYKRKPMPKQKKRAYTAFVKKVESVTSKNQGKVTAVYNSKVSLSSALDNQIVAAIHLYGFRSNIPNAELGANDIGYVINTDIQAVGDQITNAGSSGTGFGGGYDATQQTRYATNKIQFTSAVLDFTYTNTNQSSTGTHEVDVYEIMYNKNIKGNWNGITELFTQAASASYAGLVSLPGAVNTYAQTVGIAQRGVTPFEMGKALSMGNIIIQNKYKKLVSPGQAFTAQIRDPRNRWCNPQDYFASQNNYKYQDWTKTVLFIVKPVQYIDSNPTTFNIGCTRTYKYTYEGLNDNKSYYATQ